MKIKYIDCVLYTPQQAGKLPPAISNCLPISKAQTPKRNYRGLHKVLLCILILHKLGSITKKITQKKSRIALVQSPINWNGNPYQFRSIWNVHGS
jgi:hypothetical protein